MVSRRYLKEKYSAMKNDMELLDLDSNTLPDEIDRAVVDRVRYNIVDKCKSIIRELEEV